MPLNFDIQVLIARIVHDLTTDATRYAFSESASGDRAQVRCSLHVVHGTWAPAQAARVATTRPTRSPPQGELVG
jgi:hypothetical protein